MSLQIIFAGTPEFAVPTLQTLLDAGHDVCAVYTQPDRPAGRGQKRKPSPVKQLALQYDLPVIQPSTLKDDTVQQQLKAWQADVMIVVAYGLILPQAVLDTPKHGCLNVHASLLPRWRGAAPIHRAILAGDTVTGVTIMQMNAGLDTGDMLWVESCPITDEDTGQILHDRLALLGAGALLKTLIALEQDELQPVTQPKGQTTYADKIQKTEGKIDWTESAINIDRKIRAFNPWPVAYTELDGKVLRIWSAKPMRQTANHKPGTIVAIGSEGIDIAASDGVIRLLNLQASGGRPLPVKDFLNARRDWFELGANLCS